ncbi:MAG: hypothetical protein Q8M03_03025 [Legionella sp.]|nr:hypothetical protein [Legionella sp.]
MFNKNEPKYQGLLQRLQQMGDRKVLTVYVADTDESADSRHFMKAAVQELQDLLLPVVFLQQQPDDKILPVNDANSLAAKINPTTHRFWSSNAEKSKNRSASPLPGGFIGEIILTSGRKTHVERMENLLTALAEDGAKPDEIILVGDRQGALICHEIGNKVYIQFGHDIQLHFLESIAPEPRQDYEIYEKIIPPATVSFTVFYASAGCDLSHFSFSNASTMITKFSMDERLACSYIINALYGAHGMERSYPPSLICAINEKPASAIPKIHRLFTENQQSEEVGEKLVFLR